MITKITLQYQMNRSFTENERFATYDHCRSNIAGMAAQLTGISQVVDEVAISPDQDAKALLEKYFPADAIHCTHYTRKRRTYSVWMLTVHEEDRP